jgi:hypothetical protein
VIDWTVIGAAVRIDRLSHCLSAMSTASRMRIEELARGGGLQVPAADESDAADLDSKVTEA